MANLGERKRRRQAGRASLQCANDVARGLAAHPHYCFRRHGSRVHYAVVNFANLLEVQFREPQQPGRRAASGGHAARHQFQCFWFDRQRVRLPVIGELQTVFQLPQELIGGGEAPVFGSGEKPLVL